MTLDTMLGNLIQTKNGERVANDKYATKFLVETTEKLEELDKIDITTADGLKAYSTLTGDDPSKYSQEKIELRKNARLSGGEEDISTYINKHFNSVLKELDKEESTRINLSFKYCPSNDMEGHHKPYNAVATIVRSAKKELQEIAEDPTEYISTKMKNESDLMNHYIVKFAKEFLDISKREAQRTGVLSITKYDEGNVGRFLRVTRQHFDKQNTELMKKQETIGKEIATTIDAAERKAGRILFAVETATLISDKRKALGEIFIKYSDAKTLQPFTEEVAAFAIEAARKKAA